MKFLIVGLGSMGKRRVRNLSFLKAGEIVGFDPREDRRQEAAEKYCIRTVGDFGQAMSERPDALIISTPPDLHMPYMQAAAEAHTLLLRSQRGGRRALLAHPALRAEGNCGRSIVNSAV